MFEVITESVFIPRNAAITMEPEKVGVDLVIVLYQWYQPSTR